MTDLPPAHQPPLDFALDHAGISVSNLDDALYQWREILRRPVSMMEPPNHLADPSLIGMHTMSHVVLSGGSVDAGPHSWLEIHRLRKPLPRTRRHPHNEAGFSALILTVSDLPGERERLAAMGISWFGSEPQRGSRKSTWIRGRDQFGIGVELQSLPGLTPPQDIALGGVRLVVPSIAVALDWYQRMFPWTVIDESDQAIPGASLGRPDLTSVGIKTTILDTGGQISLHLTEFEDTIERNGGPFDSYGITHIAAWVGDPDRAYADLCAKHLPMASPPQHIHAGPMKGRTWWYAFDPADNITEMVNHPPA